MMKKKPIFISVLLIMVSLINFCSINCKGNTVFVFWQVNGVIATVAEKGDTVTVSGFITNEPVAQYRARVIRQKPGDDEVVEEVFIDHNGLTNPISIIFEPEYSTGEYGTSGYYIDVSRREYDPITLEEIWVEIYLMENNYPPRLTVLSSSLWKNEVVDEGGGEGLTCVWPDIAVNSSGDPHIVYCPGIVTNFASRSNNNWKLEEVPNAHHHPEPSLCFDSNDNPRIFVPNWDMSGGYYSYWTGTEWLREPVSSGWISTETRFSDMALDSHDRPHITYKAEEIRDMIMEPPAMKCGFRYEALQEPWSVEVTPVSEPGEYRGLWSSIAIDDNDKIHIVDSYTYIFYTTGSHSPGYYPNIEWETYKLEEGKEPDIAVDSLGNPHICFYSGSETALKYALWTGVNWDIHTIDNDGDVGRYPSIVIDSQDNPHICYYDVTEKALKYITREGSGWTAPYTIDSNPFYLGMYWCCSISMAIDVYDYLHICYNAHGTDWMDIKYATNAPDLNLIVEGDANGQFSVTFDAGAEKGAPVTEYTEINTINIASLTITLTDGDMIMVIEGQLQDPSLEGRIVLEIDPNGENFTYGIKIIPYETPLFRKDLAISLAILALLEILHIIPLILILLKKYRFPPKPPPPPYRSILFMVVIGYILITFATIWFTLFLQDFTMSFMFSGGFYGFGLALQLMGLVFLFRTPKEDSRR